MQTMPKQTRTAVAVGAALLALVVGAFAFWSGGSTNETQSVQDDVNEVPGYTVSDTAPTDAVTADPATQPADASAPADTSASEGTVQAGTAVTTIPETHTVKAGESLYDISRTYYNTHLYAADIEMANNLDNPDAIYEGMELKLPRKEELSELPDTTEQTAPTTAQ